MKAKKNFELLTYQITTVPGITYQSDYLLYTGRVPIIVLINASASISLLPTSSVTTNVKYVLYKGENGQFPSIPIPSIQVNTTLTPGVISGDSATGIVCLNPGDTLALYNSANVSIDTYEVYDFSVAITKIKTISCKNKSN